MSDSEETIAESSPERPSRPGHKMLSTSSPNVLMHENRRPVPPPAPHRGNTMVIESSPKAYESKPMRISTFNDGNSVSALKEKLAGLPMSPHGGFKRPVGAVSLYGSSAPSLGGRSTVVKGVPIGFAPPPVPAKKDTTLPRFCRFVIAEKTNSIQEEKKFTRVSSVNSVTKWSVREFGLDKSVDYRLMLEDTVLDPDRILWSYTSLRDGSRLELTPYHSEELMAKVQVPDMSYVFTVKINAETSVWSLLLRIMKKLVARNTGNLTSSNYALHCGEAQVEMLEDDFVFKYNSTEDPVIHESKTFSQNIVYKTKSHIEEDFDLTVTVFYNDESVSFSFISEETVDKCVRRFLKDVHIKSGVISNPLEYTFSYVPDDGGEDSITMDSTLPLSHYNLKEGQHIEFQKRIQDFTIDLPSDLGPLTLSLDRTTTTSEVMDLIHFNYFNHFGERLFKDYQLYIKRDLTPLIDYESIWSLDEPQLILKRKLLPISIMLNNNNQRVFVDFSEHVMNIMSAIWTSFHVEPMRRDEYVMKRISPDVSVDMNKSLEGQDIQPNTVLVIRVISPIVEEPVVEEEEQENVVQDENQVEENNENEERLAKTAKYDDNGKITAGTLTTLVEHVTFTSDLDDMKAFLMTYTSFTSAGQLLEKLISRHAEQQVHEETDPETLKKIKQIQLKVCNVLKYWMENYYQDFNHELTQLVVNFVDNLPVEQKNLVGKQINKAVLQRTCGLKMKEKVFIHIKHYPEIITIKTKKKGDEPLSVFDFDDLEVARQLTLITFSIYETIQPVELIDQNWSKDKTKHKSPNLIYFIDHLNIISFWMAHLILEPARASQRAKRFTFFCKVLEHMRTLNNFSGVTAFIAGFSNSAIARLKFTKNLVPKKNLEFLGEMEQLMNTASSFKVYRDAVQYSNPPLIPYIGTYLTDLTFIDEGNPDKIEGLFNWSKRKLIYNVISKIQQYQQTRYQLQVYTLLENYLSNLPKKDGDNLYNISLQREPRNAEKVL